MRTARGPAPDVCRTEEGDSRPVESGREMSQPRIMADEEAHTSQHSGYRKKVQTLNDHDRMTVGPLHRCHRPVIRRAAHQHWM